MSNLKNKLSEILYIIRNPEHDEQEFKKELSFKRLLILAPFIIAAIIFLLLSFK